MSTPPRLAYRALLIERDGYTILKNALTGGVCPTCRTTIPGAWH